MRSDLEFYSQNANQRAEIGSQELHLQQYIEVYKKQRLLSMMESGHSFHFRTHLLNNINCCAIWIPCFLPSQLQIWREKSQERQGLDKNGSAGFANETGVLWQYVEAPFRSNFSLLPGFILLLILLIFPFSSSLIE